MIKLTYLVFSVRLPFFKGSNKRFTHMLKQSICNSTLMCRYSSVFLAPSLRYLRGRVFVLELLPGSQAQVDRALCPGDIIDEINGVSLRNSKNGQVRRSLISVIQNPVTFKVIESCKNIAAISLYTARAQCSAECVKC